MKEITRHIPLLKSWLALTVVIAGLVACSTPSSRRDEPPEISFSVERPALDVTRCIVDAWEELWRGGPITMRETDAGYEIFYHDRDAWGVLFLADVDAQGELSIVSYYDQWFLRREKIREGLLECR